MKKRFILPVAALVIVAAGLGWYYMGGGDGVGPKADIPQSPSTKEEESWVVPDGYKSYESKKYGFAFDYRLGVGEQLITVPSLELDDDLQAAWMVGMPGSGSVSAWVNVYDGKDLASVLATKEVEMKDSWDSYRKTTKTVNGLALTVYKFHGEYADANHEWRFVQLKNGYVISIRSSAANKGTPDSKLLDSLRTI